LDGVCDVDGVFDGVCVIVRVCVRVNDCVGVLVLDCEPETVAVRLGVTEGDAVCVCVSEADMVCVAGCVYEGVVVVVAVWLAVGVAVPPAYANTAADAKKSTRSIAVFRAAADKWARLIGAWPAHTPV
jgi:hypothetical protein